MMGDGPDGTALRLHRSIELVRFQYPLPHIMRRRSGVQSSHPAPIFAVVAKW